MKKIILLILPIALISLCSYLPDIQLPSLNGQNTQVASIDSGSPDIFLNVETTSTDIKGGRDVQVFFELRNKQNYDLSNVKLNVYDNPCFSSTSNVFTKTNCGSGGTLRANQSCMWSWRWTSDTYDADRDCSIKFSTTYTAKNSIYQDIVVLPQAEYFQRQVDGTLSNIPVYSSSPPGPLSLSLTFSEPQPFIAKASYGMYINYNNVGKGFFDYLGIKLTKPDNIDLNCDQEYYDTSLTLKKDLEFVNGRSVPTNCNFATHAVNTLDIKSLSADIHYTYILYNSFSITVRGTGI